MNTFLKVKVLEFSKAKEGLYVVVFAGLAIYIPYVVHFFGGVGVGQKLLPMPFFVLLAGIMLGWRAGIATAIAAPLMSFSFSGMPAITILPFIIFQLTILGAISGILRHKNIIISLTAAIVASWITLGIMLSLFSKINVLNYVTNGIKNGAPGIILQLILIPIILFVINKYFNREKEI